jgi:hypothetical protein
MIARPIGCEAQDDWSGKLVIRGGAILLKGYVAQVLFVAVAALLSGERTGVLAAGLLVPCAVLGAMLMMALPLKLIPILVVVTAFVLISEGFKNPAKRHLAVAGFRVLSVSWFGATVLLFFLPVIA